jgi:hypothetical protein
MRIGYKRKIEIHEPCRNALLHAMELINNTLKIENVRRGEVRRVRLALESYVELATALYDRIELSSKSGLGIRNDMFMKFSEAEARYYFSWLFFMFCVLTC